MARRGGFQGGKLADVCVDLVGEPAQQPGPVAGRDGAPGFLRPGRALDGRVGLLSGRVLDLRDRLLGGRVDDGVAGHGVSVMSLLGVTRVYRRSKQRRSSQSVTAASNAASSTRA